MSYKNNAYFIVNLIFVILIGIALGYSYFFYPNNHPIGCVVREMTGKDCSTCGFSRAFSSFTHFQFTIGKNFNLNAFNCFLFFITQFFLRSLILSYIFFIKKEDIYYKYKVYELVFTVIAFLIIFIPLLL
jgi:hypothetical protein